MQAVEPVVAAYFPGSHVMHAPAEAPPVVDKDLPTTQPVQVCAPAALHVPAAHSVHLSESWDAATKPASERYFPATHAVQDAVCSPVALLHVPYAQIVQSETSSWLAAVVVASTRYLPAGHAVHDVAVAIVAV